jgi:hypothetical protein
MAACIKIVLSGNPGARNATQASLPSQTVVFRNSRPGQHPAFMDFTIQRNETVSMRVNRSDRQDTID